VTVPGYPTAPSAHVDTFARDNLPPAEQWPQLLFDRPELRYPERINCGVELLDAAVAEGHGARVGVVGVRGPQAQELRLARQPTALVKFLDDDVVEVTGPMHGGAAIGLGDHQQLALGAERHQIARRPGAHDAQRGAWNRLEM